MPIETGTILLQFLPQPPFGGRDGAMGGRLSGENEVSPEPKKRYMHIADIWIIS